MLVPTFTFKCTFNKIKWKTLLRNSSTGSLPLQDEIALPKSKPNLCSSCFTYLGYGHSHNCTTTNVVADIITLAFVLGLLHKE